MFPIMTEEQIKAADEEVLRQRVRELSSASAVLHQIRDLQQKMIDGLNVLAGLLLRIEDHSEKIEEHLRPKMKKTGKRPPKHISKRWPGAGSRGVRKAMHTIRNKKMKVTLAKVKQ